VQRGHRSALRGLRLVGSGSKEVNWRSMNKAVTCNRMLSAVRASAGVRYGKVFKGEGRARSFN
jgi:hypothetical protein